MGLGSLSLILAQRDSPSEFNSHKDLILHSTEERIWDEYDSKHLLSERNIPVMEEKLIEALSEAGKVAEDRHSLLLLRDSDSRRDS